MPKRPPQGRGSGGRVTPSAKRGGSSTAKGSAAKTTGTAKGSAAKTTGTAKAADATVARPKARVQAPSPRARSKANRATGDRTDRTDRTDDAEPDDVEDTTAEDEPRELVRPPGIRGLFQPLDADYVKPADRTRPWWGMGDMGLFFLISQIAGAVAYYTAAAAGNYSLYWPAGPGARAGEVVGRIATGQAPAITKTVLDMPLALTQAIQIPLWIGFLGGPIYAAKRKGTSLKDDFGFTMQWRDVPIGLAIGAFCQVVLLTILYKFIFVFTGEQDVSARARELTDKATSPALTIVLVLGVAIAAPVFEELFFRGLSQRAIVKRLGPVFGVVLSALFFALAHFQYLQFPGLLVFGLVLAILAQRFGRLGPCIFAHIGFNLVAAVLLVWNVELP